MILLHIEIIRNLPCVFKVWSASTQACISAVLLVALPFTGFEILLKEYLPSLNCF